MYINSRLVSGLLLSQLKTIANKQARSLGHRPARYTIVGAIPAGMATSRQLELRGHCLDCQEEWFLNPESPARQIVFATTALTQCVAHPKLCCTPGCDVLAMKYHSLCYDCYQSWLSNGEAKANG